MSSQFGTRSIPQAQPWNAAGGNDQAQSWWLLALLLLGRKRIQSWTGLGWRRQRILKSGVADGEEELLRIPDLGGFSSPLSLNSHLTEVTEKAGIWGAETYKFISFVRFDKEMLFLTSELLEQTSKLLLNYESSCWQRKRNGLILSWNAPEIALLKRVRVKCSGRDMEVQCGSSNV